MSILGIFSQTAGGQDRLEDRTTSVKTSSGKWAGLIGQTPGIYLICLMDGVIPGKLAVVAKVIAGCAMGVH